VTGLRVTTASSETPLRQLATLVRNLTSQSTILPVVSQQLAVINLHLGGIRIDGANQRYEVTRFRR
jgi:hypothetical protein